MSDLKCTVVTPDSTVYDANVDFVALTLYDGEIGIAPGRSPLIGRLGAGEMRLRKDEKVSRYYVDGGFVEVLDDTVTILTHEALAAETLDPFVLQTKLEDALDRPTDTAEERAARKSLIAEYQGKLHVAKRHAAEK